ncbi:MAG TPA: dTMP kinase [Planctomycetota bacterium]|jgi:dTMP kinase|nr:dTMP kinase [Planctomycetota bacterium]
MRRGVFLVLDGPDGAGKTTQVRRLARRMRRGGRRVLVVREPGGTPLGEALRRLLLRRTVPLGAKAQALLFAAARAELLDRVVAPALRRGRIVLSDRGGPSTFAYQGIAGGLGRGRVLALARAFHARPRPDLVVLLDVAPGTARKRRRGRDRFERKGVSFARAVRRGFRAFARRSRGRVVLLDGRGPRREVEEAVWRAVERILP